jgi:hypothetical protein
MKKQLENPEKKKKAKHPSRPSSTQPGHAPASPDRWAPVASPPHPFSFSLRRGPSLSAPPRPCPHSLPRLILRSPALARALLTLPDLAGDPRPPPRPSSLQETAPSHPELRPEVRHLYPCSVSPILLCGRPISALSEFGRGGPPRPRGDRPN